jgi:hypothetical protein
LHAFCSRFSESILSAAASSCKQLQVLDIIDVDSSSYSLEETGASSRLSPRTFASSFPGVYAREWRCEGARWMSKMRRCASSVEGAKVNNVIIIIPIN